MSVTTSRKTLHIPRSIFVPIFLLVLSFSLFGCSGKKGSGTSTETKNSPTPDSTRTTKSVKRDPETMLSGVYQMCLPDRLGLKTTVDSATNRMNEWLDSLRKREESISLDIPADILSRIGSLYSKTQMKRIQNQQFDHRDIRHLRNQILLRNITERLTERLTEKQTKKQTKKEDSLTKKPPKKEDILKDCTKLFYYTVRNVVLIDEKDTVPFTPFRILLWGRGTVEDRAWIFASLLKQYTKARVDAVILKPKSGDFQADSSNILIGVIIHSAAHQGKVYLYDPLLGIPLPAKTTDKTPSILVDHPATLEEFTRDDTVFERLRDRSDKYRLKPQDLKQVTCQIISDSSYASPRSKLLQNSFDKNQEVLVYEQLFDRTKQVEQLFDQARQVDSQQRGLIDRISNFSSAAWSPKDVSLWAYPEEISHRLENVGDEPIVNRKIERIIDVFRAPLGSTIINELFRSRVAHLMGKYGDALKGYLQVRIIGSDEESTQKSASAILNAIAARDAEFWSCIVKIEQEKFKSAVALLNAYERKQQTKEHYFGNCMFWLGYALMKNRKFAAAVQSLSRIPELVPAYRTGRYYLPKWRAIRDSQ